MAAGYEHLAAALPGYEIGDEIGRGAWGVVVAGRHRALGREVAIKQLSLHIGREPAVRARFLAEARALAQFDHPHIVRIFDFVEHDGECLLVMERLPGGTAYQRMRSDEPAPPTACSWAVAVCAGLQYAHDREILHRDVKPENLMFSHDGVLRVTDFGIAKLMTATGATQTGQVMGTPAYIAPEQAQGRPLTPATDVYAAGTVLYELLSGRLPYDPVDSPLFALFQHVHEDHRPLSETAPAVPPPVVAVVERALAKDPDERFPTAGAMGLELARAGEEAWGPVWADELNRVLRSPLATPPPSAPAGRPTVFSETGPPELPPAEPGPPTGDPGRRRPWRAIAAAGLAVAALVVGVLLLTGGEDDPSGVELAGLPPAPAVWPSELVVGVDYGSQADAEDSAHLRETSGARLQGFTAGHGWTSYDTSGRWAENAAADAVAGGVFPYFTYLTIGQAGPGAEIAAAGAAQRADLDDPETMSRYWADVRELLSQIQTGSRGEGAALEVEPTLWPLQELHGEQSAENVSAIVGSSRVPELRGLPDNLAGFAQGWIALRDQFAPNIALGYPTADWGSGSEVVVDDLAGTEISDSAARNAAFYRSLDAEFDFGTLAVADHDAGFGRVVRHDAGRSLWTPDDYVRHTDWVAAWVDDTGLRVVLTTIPFGNTQMAAVNDTAYHYQDNHVEKLLAEDELATLDAYRRAGVIGLVFGTGRVGQTCPCDAANDGVTNPPPEAGNAGRPSLSADDDGGYWREQTSAYVSDPLEL